MDSRGRPGLPGAGSLPRPDGAGGGGRVDRRTGLDARTPRRPPRARPRRLAGHHPARRAHRPRRRRRPLPPGRPPQPPRPRRSGGRAGLVPRQPHRAGAGGGAPRRHRGRHRRGRGCPPGAGGPPGVGPRRRRPREHRRPPPRRGHHPPGNPVEHGRARAGRRQRPVAVGRRCGGRGGAARPDGGVVRGAGGPPRDTRTAHLGGRLAPGRVGAGGRSRRRPLARLPLVPLPPDDPVRRRPGGAPGPVTTPSGTGRSGSRRSGRCG